MEEEKTDEPEESHLDRKKRYVDLIAKGVTDKEAVEQVWPSTTARIAKNAKDKKDADDKEKEGKKDGSD